MPGIGNLKKVIVPALNEITTQWERQTNYNTHKQGQYCMILSIMRFSGFPTQLFSHLK